MKIRTIFSVLLIVGIYFVLGGCSTVTYNGMNYSSVDDALQAQDQDLLKISEEIVPREKPLANSVLLVIPDKIAIGDKGILKSRLATPEAVDYVSMVSYKAIRYLHDALIKRNTFNKIDISETANTEEYVQNNKDGYSVAVYYMIVSPEQQGWYLIGKDNKKTSFSYDKSLPVGKERLLSLITDLENKINNIK